MITSYQFIKFKEEAFVDFHRKLSEMNTISCFDFEDGVIDFKKNDTNRYKSDYRKKVIDLLIKYKTRTLKSFLSFRINEYGTNRYFDDLQTLEVIKDVKLNSIFLSKCNSPEVLENFLKDTKDFRFDEVIPIMESNDALTNLEEISKFKHPKFRNISFGHNDYNLNCNIFPFIHQDNPRYWSWIQKFQKICEKEKLGFINSPYLNLNHSENFKLLLKNMSNYFKDWGQITLNTQQSELCHRFSISAPVKTEERNQNNEINVKEYAEKIVHLFEKYNPEGKGYTIMPDTKEFICPQEYIAAKRFLYE
ncbi:MAG: hypothetical protein LBQ22_09145 [Bacteroidales bacterium]|jgi:hypothetical protein|nr:hypothetical protein [Bacteroidales bacterium]